MIEKLPLKSSILVFVVAVLLWSVLSGPSDNGGGASQVDQTSGLNPLVSAIQPLSSANANSVKGVLSGDLTSVSELSQVQNSKLNNLFSSAVSSDSDALAIERYSEVIKQFPSAIEPYLNLASIYASNGELEQSRQTLMKGFEHNPKAYLLFSSLQKVHGALAATAYSKALNTQDTGVNKVVLPSTKELVTTLDQQAQIDALNKQVVALSSSAHESRQASVDSKTVMGLEAELAELQQKLNSIQKTHNQELTGLNSQLSYSNKLLLESQTSEREALTRAVRAERQVSANKESGGEQKVNALEAQLLAMKNQLDAVTNASSEESSAAKQRQANVKSAIALVQSWAKSWSSQDVKRYASHYAPNYTPTASLSHRQWLAQRQQRLTNKVFIKVYVSNFKIQDLNGRFSVTFTQNYKSNTMDDTVVKQLVFNKKGDSWANAKIVNESIISR